MKRAIQEKVWKDTLEEEMRILYVAMTRAKRKLILRGTSTTINEMASPTWIGVRQKGV